MAEIQPAQMKFLAEYSYELRWAYTGVSPAGAVSTRKKG